MKDSKEKYVNTETNIDRRKISPEIINTMRFIDAGEEYRNFLYKKFFGDFKEKPFISLDREKNTDWLKMISMFPDKLIKKEKMNRFSDGLLPGHVYLIFWLNKNKKTRKLPPSYFEYEFGINAKKEVEFLKSNGFINADNKATEKGLEVISKHYEVCQR